MHILHGEQLLMFIFSEFYRLLREFRLPSHWWHFRLCLLVESLACPHEVFNSIRLDSLISDVLWIELDFISGWLFWIVSSKMRRFFSLSSSLSREFSSWRCWWFTCSFSFSRRNCCLIWSLSIWRMFRFIRSSSSLLRTDLLCTLSVGDLFYGSFNCLFCLDSNSKAALSVMTFMQAISNSSVLLLSACYAFWVAYSACLNSSSLTIIRLVSYCCDLFIALSSIRVSLRASSNFLVASTSWWFSSDSLLFESIIDSFIRSKSLFLLLYAVNSFRSPSASLSRLFSSECNLLFSVRTADSSPSVLAFIDCSSWIIFWLRVISSAYRLSRLLSKCEAWRMSASSLDTASFKLSRSSISASILSS